MTSDAHDDRIDVPRGALLAAAAMIVLTLVAVATVRLGLVAPAADPQQLRIEAGAHPIVARDLVFADESGSVLVRDAATGATRVAVPAGSKTGFIRGVMRGLARDRHLRGVSAALPFRLTRWSNGDLTLADLATGRAPIELGSFGPTNKAAFEVLL